MPSIKNKSKTLTRQDKPDLSAELTAHGRVNDIQDASLHTASEQQAYSIFVPVFYNNKQFMPTTPSRARKLIKSKQATPFFKKGIFCIRLNRPPSSEEVQEVEIGIDPGSKKDS